MVNVIYEIRETSICMHIFVDVSNLETFWLGFLKEKMNGGAPYLFVGIIPSPKCKE